MDFIDHRSAATFKFGLSATDEKLRITSDGDVGIGVTNPSTKLEVDGVITSTGIDVTGSVVSDGLTVDVNSDGATATAASFKNNGSGANTKARLDFFAAATRYAGISGGYGSSAPELSFDISGTDVLSVTPTGIDVTGSVSADGLTVDGGAVINLASTTGTTLGQKGGLELFANSGTIGNGGELTWQAGSGSTETWAAISGYILENNASGSRGHMLFGTKNATADTVLSERMRISSNGDISFYEDTGTTAKLFWDSSAESLNVGSTQLNFSTVKVQTGSATDAAAGFNVFTSATGDGYLLFSDGNVGNQSYSGQVRYNHASDFMAFGTAGGVERMRIDSSGNVGINTVPTRLSSNAHTLNIKAGVASKGGALLLESSDESLRSYFYPTSTGTQIGTLTNHDLLLMTNSAERMRIDSSGNVGIGTSSPDNLLDIYGTDDREGVFVRNSTNTNYRGYYMGATDVDNVPYGGIELNANSGELRHYAGPSVYGGFQTFYSSGTERMRLDTSGNVGIGTTTTSNYRFNVLRADGNTAFFTDGTTADLFIKCASGVTTLSPTTGTLAFGTSSTERMRIDASGHLIVPNGVTLGTSVGTYAAANTLDDYEEGTFTPEFIGTGGNPTVTYDTTVGNVGTYVKIGKVCHFQINIRTDSVSGGSGDLKVSGLPFTSKSGTGQIGISTAAIRATSFASNTPRVATISEGVTVVNLMTRTSITGDDSPTAVSALATGADSNLLRITGTYEVA